MIQAKLHTLDGTVSCSTAAPHFFMPRPKSTFQWTDRAMLELATPNALEKGGDAIEDMFKQLPPHGKLDCVTHLLTNEAIDEAISRIEKLEGMYKMYWILVHKAQNADQRTDHKKTLTQKG